MNTEVSESKQAAQSLTAIQPRTIEELVKFSLMLSKSNLVPEAFRNKEADIFVAIQWGMEIGLQAMQALQSIAVINGRPSLWGDAGLALVYASGLCESFDEEIGAESCTCRTKRKGNAKETVRTFTKEDAVKAGLWGKGTYEKYPKRMLQMRARWWALRDAFTDVLRGVSGAEELMDVEIDVTPPPTEVPQPQAKSERQALDAEMVTPTPAPAPAATEKKADDGGFQQAPIAAGTKPANDAAAANGTPMKEGQLNIIRAKLKNAALTDADLMAKFGSTADLKFGQFQEIVDWIAERAKATVG